MRPTDVLRIVTSALADWIEKNGDFPATCLHLTHVSCGREAVGFNEWFLGFGPVMRGHGKTHRKQFKTAAQE
jgi:hypothetical protein